MDKDNKKQLVKHLLSGRLTKEQRKTFAELDFVDKELKKQWEEAGITMVDIQTKELIWRKITARCEQDNRSYPIFSRLKWHIVAASLAIILTIGGVWLTTRGDEVNNELLKVTALQSQLHILPDSTKVWMEAGSTIQYAKAFNNNRKVWLKGNSLFEVTKHEKSTFRVFIDKAFIEVKGTCFSIKQNCIHQNEITLISGSIHFTLEATQETILLKPMQRITYNPQQGEVQIKEVTKINWDNGKYHLYDMPLTELIQTINRLYDAHISLKDDVKKESAFTGTIRYDEPLTDVLNKICFSLNLNISKENGIITIY